MGTKTPQWAPPSDPHTAALAAKFNIPESEVCKAKGKKMLRIVGDCLAYDVTPDGDTLSDARVAVTLAKNAEARRVAMLDSEAAHRHQRKLDLAKVRIDASLPKEDRDALGIITPAEKAQAQLEKKAKEDADKLAKAKAKMEIADTQLAESYQRLAAVDAKIDAALDSAIDTLSAPPSVPQSQGMSRDVAEIEAQKAGFPQYMRCRMPDASEANVPRAEFLMFAGRFEWLDAPQAS